MNIGRDLRVLTIQEPWASAIAAGRKTWENRGRRNALFARDNLLTKWVAIHAGQKMANVFPPDGQPWPPPQHGRIVCLARVAEVAEPPTGEPPVWRMTGFWGIRFDRVVKVIGVRTKGQLGWWILRNNDFGAWDALVEQVRRVDNNGNERPLPGRRHRAG